MKTGAVSTRAGAILSLGTSAAFHGVWEALNQYIDNRDDSIEDEDRPEEEKARLAEVQKVIDGMDEIMRRVADAGDRRASAA